MSNIFTSIEGACAGTKGPEASAPTPSAPPPTTPTSSSVAAAATSGLPHDAPPPGQEAPPPYSTLPNTADNMGGATGWQGLPPQSAPILGMAPRGVKVTYMDFVPRLVKKKLTGSVYEDFGVLVDRANTWIDEHAGISILSCETVTWSGHHYEDIYADKCYNVQGHRIIRGLRLWYLTETVPSPQRHRTPNVLHCRTFQPKPTETFSLLLRRVNDSLLAENIGGKILCVETMPLYCPVSEYKPGAVNPELTRWTGDISRATVALCLRVYILVMGEAHAESIGYQDFVPEHTQRHADNRGFEVCSELMDKATRWVARQQGVRFTNVQTLNVKYKKKIPFEERCVYTAQENTVFLSIVRVFYVLPTGRGGTEARIDLPPCRLTYRTFTPAQTSTGSYSGPVEYDDTRNLCDRINQWLQISGAKLFSIETVPLRMSSGSLGSEATFFRTKHGGERWLYHVRVYLNGDYMEPPGAVGLVTPTQTKSEPNIYFASR